MVHTAPIIPASISPHSPADGALTIHNNNQPSIRPQPNIQTLDQKLAEMKWRAITTKSPKPWWIGSCNRPTHSLRWYYWYRKWHQRYIHPSCPYTNGQSRTQKQHPVAQALEADIDVEIKRMATESIIESCTNPRGFNNPVFAVRKKNGSVHMVANFKRTLNKILVDLNPYPMPRINHLFNRIGEGNKYFASLDLRSSYWQIEINEQDRHKTAFTWRDQCYQYTCLAFSLTSAGQISRCIAEALATVESHDNISSYIDDNLVHAKTFNKYILVLEQLFVAFCKLGLKLNLDKCTFLTSEAKFLGHIVNSKRFKADPEYVCAIREMTPPTSKKELHWPFSMDQTIPRDSSTLTDQIWHILKSYESYTWT